MATPKSSNVLVGFSLLSSFSFPKDKTYFIITDTLVASLWLPALEQALASAHVHSIILPPGEAMKSLPTYTTVIEWLVAHGCHRDSCLIALGGGIVTDFVGFVASTLFRGISFYSIPTSLVGMVDASVGYKNALNVGHLKNVIGTFYEPEKVLCSLSTLETLPDEVFAEGLSEILKIALLQSNSFFEWCERHWDAILSRDDTVLEHLVLTAVQLKEGVALGDVNEKGARATLNLGHTLAHAIEAALDYKLSHGAAVSCGLCFALFLSEERVGLDPVLRPRVASLLERAGLPVTLPRELSIPLLCEKMGFDKKARVDGLYFIMLKGVSEAVIQPVPSSEWLAQKLNSFVGR